MRRLLKMNWQSSSRVVLVFCLGFVLLGSGNCGSSFWGEEQAYSEETKEIDTARLDKLALTTRSGKIEAIGSSEEKIRLTIVKKASASSKTQAQAMLEKIRLVEKKDGGTQRVFADLPSGSCSVDFLVTLPSRCALELDSQNGLVKLKGMEGAINAKTHNGAVVVLGARDPVRIRSFNGEVRLQGNPSMIDLSAHHGTVQVALESLRAFEKESRIETHDGEIQVNFPVGFSSKLRASTSSGRVRAELPGKWETQESFEVSGLLGLGGPAIWIESHNGDILLRHQK